MGVPRVSNRWIPILIFGISISLSGWAGVQPPKLHYLRNPEKSDSTERSTALDSSTELPSPVYKKWAGFDGNPEEQTAQLATEALKDPRGLETLIARMEEQDGPLSPVQEEFLKNAKKALENQESVSVEDALRDPEKSPSDLGERAALSEAINQALKKQNPNLSDEELKQAPLPERIKMLRDLSGEASKKNKPTSDATSTAKSDPSLSSIRAESSQALPAVKGRKALNDSGQEFPITQIDKNTVARPVFKEDGSVDPTRMAVERNGGYVVQTIPQNLGIDPRSGNFFMKPEGKSSAESSSGRQAEKDAAPAPETASAKKGGKEPAPITRGASQERPASQRSENSASPSSVEKLENKNVTSETLKNLSGGTDSIYIQVPKGLNDPKLSESLNRAGLSAAAVTGSNGENYVLKMQLEGKSADSAANILTQAGLDETILKQLILPSEIGREKFDKQIEGLALNKGNFVNLDAAKRSAKKVLTVEPTEGIAEAKRYFDTGGKEQELVLREAKPRFSPQSYDPDLRQAFQRDIPNLGQDAFSENLRQLGGNTQAALRQTVKDFTESKDFSRMHPIDQLNTYSFYGVNNEKSLQQKVAPDIVEGLIRSPSLHDQLVKAAAPALPYLPMIKSMVSPSPFSEMPFPIATGNPRPSKTPPAKK